MLGVVEHEAADEEVEGRSVLDEITREGARRMLLAALETEVAAYPVRRQTSPSEHTPGSARGPVTGSATTTFAPPEVGLLHAHGGGRVATRRRHRRRWLALASSDHEAGVAL